MPKLVDPQQRRRLVIDAFFRLIRDEGIERASLRNVATEAELNIGSVRHYFDDYDDLLTAAVDELVDRISARLLAHVDRLPPPGDTAGRYRVALDMLEELLPLDERRRAETTVWLTLAERSRTVPALRPAAERLFEGTRTMIKRIVDRAGVDQPAIRVETIASLIDGLAYNGVHFPDRLSSRRARQVLKLHLETQLNHRIGTSTD
ncbi:TetR/AcrR family transcriptional regulator [Microlunatus speluncae]|uniref:TetR/AcrR family transcriptional regulator n=1 Tax=Microlunatus speluncae TaxID=2594267 RepID=UPI00126657B8|nr:TetR family transcriptional regulator C-terminal domain-containing protein [Microlunatus speluncae]